MRSTVKSKNGKIPVKSYYTTLTMVVNGAFNKAKTKPYQKAKKAKKKQI